MSTKSNALFQIIFIYIIIAISGLLGLMYIQTGSEVVDFLMAHVVMTVVCFICSLVKRNSSVYDPFWSIVPFFFTVAWAYLHTDILNIYHIITFVVINLWSWRLTFNWVRSWSGFDHEDWRYVELAEKSGALYPIVNFFGIHLFPTFWVFGGMWPLFYMFGSELQSLALFIVGVITSLAGFLFEFFADNQLAAFRRRQNPKTEDLLDTGLWGRSRHPNYLGELLFWIGLFAIGYSFGAPLMTIAGCVALILLFMLASIPWKERRMAERRPAFKEYQRRVPMLIPSLKSK